MSPTPWASWACSSAWPMSAVMGGSLRRRHRRPQSAGAGAARQAGGHRPARRQLGRRLPRPRGRRRSPDRWPPPGDLHRRLGAPLLDDRRAAQGDGRARRRRRRRRRGQDLDDAVGRASPRCLPHEAVDAALVVRPRERARPRAPHPAEAAVLGLGRRHRAADRPAARSIPASPVISVGNLTVGGSGKTPVVARGAAAAARRGRRRPRPVARLRRPAGGPGAGRSRRPTPPPRSATSR